MELEYSSSDKALMGDTASAIALCKHYMADMQDEPSKKVITAYPWCRAAAEAGDPFAQEMMGNCNLAATCYVDPNVIEGYFWLSLAAKNKTAHDAARVKKLESTIPTDKLAELTGRLAAWKPVSKVDIWTAQPFVKDDLEIADINREKKKAAKGDFAAQKRICSLQLPIIVEGAFPELPNLWKLKCRRCMTLAEKGFKFAQAQTGTCHYLDVFRAGSEHEAEAYFWWKLSGNTEQNSLFTAATSRLSSDQIDTQDKRIKNWKPSSTK